MDRKNSQTKTDSTGVCKKIYKAVAANPAFRAIPSKSGSSQSPVAAITDPNQTGVQTTGNTAKPAVSSLKKEKLKQKKAAASNIIGIQDRGQGINVQPKVEPAKPHHMTVQQEQPKPKVQATSMLKTKSTKNHQPNLHDKGDQQGKKPEKRTVNDKFSDYITSIKNKITPSNVGGETKNARPITRLATRRDSFNNRVVDYINRARKKIRTTSNVGDA